MKKALSLLLAGVLCVGLLAGCGGQNSESQSSSTSSTNSTTSSASSTDSSANSTDSSTSTTASSETSNKKIDTLRIAFVPSREPEEIITATEPLKQMLTDELATLGYDVGEVDITVGTSYEAVGEALAAGTADVGLIPGGTYVLYDDGCDVLLTATRDGLSIDSDNAKDWNDNAPTEPTTEQVTSYRALMIAGPSEKGKELAAKVNAGEALTLGGREQCQLECGQFLLSCRIHLPLSVAPGELRQEYHRPCPTRCSLTPTAVPSPVWPPVRWTSSAPMPTPAGTMRMSGQPSTA